jgi:hypothetical protein
MSAVTEASVREFFEQRGFLVRQQRKYQSSNLRDDEEVDLYAANPEPVPATAPLPFILTAEDVGCIERAVVGVIGRHSGSFTVAALTKEPEVFRFAEAAALREAARFFKVTTPILRVLVAPSLPQDDTTRQQCLDYVKGRGVDAVLPFPAVLADLVSLTEATRNYQKSDILQTIRLLKHYGLLRDPQMELFKHPRRR